MYKRINNAAVLLLAVIMTACSGSKHTKSKRLPGTWQKEPITIDGNNKDWPSPYPEYDSKAMLGYAVSNDKENLYITVETGDPATQLKILREGLTVWIDKTGGKDQVTAINYPLPNHNKITTSGDEDKPAAGQWQHGNGSGADKRRLDMEDRVHRLLGEAKEYSLQGFKSCNLQYPLLERDTCGITVRMGIDADNEMVWEAVVPFKSFYNKHQIEQHDKGKAISVCFETIGSKKPAGQGGGNRGGNRGGGMSPRIGFGGMGGMGMGMHTGGGRGMRGGSGNAPANDNIMESLYKNTTTWKTFGIAVP